MDIIKSLAKELNISDDRMRTVFQKVYNDNLQFTTPEAKEMWEQNGKPVISPLNIRWKATKDDIKRSIGEKSSATKDPSHWSSPKAREMAEEHELTPDDFPMATRTGHELKSGFKKISLADVKAKIGLPTGKFSSQGVADMAASGGLTTKDFPGVKTIKKADVVAKLAEKQTVNPFE